MYISPDQAETASHLVGILVGVSLTILAIISARAAKREWRYQHITKEWASLVQFLMGHAGYMQPQRNENYKTEYTDEESVKYELVARLCIAYLDDVYHLKMWNYQKGWLVGSVQFLAGTHRRWLEDHRDAYSRKFHDELIECLKVKQESDELTQGGKPWWRRWRSFIRFPWA